MHGQLEEQETKNGIGTGIGICAKSCRGRDGSELFFMTRTHGSLTLFTSRTGKN